MKLATAALHGDEWSMLKVYYGIESQEIMNEFRRQIRADLERETIDSSKVIISSEHLSSFLLKDDEVAWLSSFLSSLFDSVRVVIYLRRQDLFHASFYSTAVKLGATAPLAFPRPDIIKMRYDYKILLERWKEFFPNIAVRVFDPSRLVGGDVVSDFIDFSGIGHVVEHAEGPKANQSIEISHIEFLRVVNNSLPLLIDGKLNPEREFLESCLDSILGFGGKVNMKRADAVQLMEHLRPANMWVAQNFLHEVSAEGDPLFGRLEFEPGSKQDGIGAEDMLRTALGMIRARETNCDLPDAVLIGQMFAAWWAKANTKS